MKNKKLNILIAAGGTGGHLFPALAVLEQLENLLPGQVSARFVGSMNRIEAKVIPELGYDFHPLSISGFYGIFSLKTLLLPFKIISSVMKCKSIIKKNNIDIVLCTGAYLSYPAGVAASKTKTPLVIMESNVNPGKTIQMLAPKADLFITSFDETLKRLPVDIKAKSINLGNPVRKQMDEPLPKEKARIKFGLKPDKKALLVFGGSLGAKAINEAMENFLEHNKPEFQIIWQTGNNYSPRGNYDDNVKVLTFINDMGAAYSAADLVVSRSGATTVSEICLIGKPSILVPLPTASNNEQDSNADVLDKNGAAIKILNDEIGIQLPELLEALFNDNDRLEEMAINARKLSKPDAASDSAKKILELIKF